MKVKDRKIIDNISKEVYEKYKDKLYKTVKITPELERMMKEVIDNKYPALAPPPEELEQIKAAYELGLYSKTTEEEVPEIAEKIHIEVQERIVEEIKKGNLTNPKDDPTYKDFKKKQNARNNKK